MKKTRSILIAIGIMLITILFNVAVFSPNTIDFADAAAKFEGKWYDWVGLVWFDACSILLSAAFLGAFETSENPNSTGKTIAFGVLWVIGLLIIYLANSNSMI
jgi:hypothetical protein